MMKGNTGGGGGASSRVRLLHANKAIAAMAVHSLLVLGIGLSVCHLPIRKVVSPEKPSSIDHDPAQGFHCRTSL